MYGACYYDRYGMALTNRALANTVRSLALVTPPTSLPVSLAEAKAHLRIEHIDDDFVLRFYIQAATAYLDGKDGWLQRALMPQTWELTLDAFPLGDINLPLPPLISVESVKYLDGDDAEQTIGSTGYVVAGNSPGRVSIVANTSWPATTANIAAARIRFRAGYVGGAQVLGESEGELAADVPAPIRLAILGMVALWYDHRGDGDSDFGLPAFVKTLVAPYKIYVMA